MQDYPFLHCLNPQHIINPATGEKLTVPCGKCKACLMRKASSFATRADMERASHKYTLFVTLTYSNEYVPRIKPILNSDGVYSLIDICTRSNDYGTEIGKIDYTKEDMDNFLNKVDLGDNTFTYALKRDLQLYIKRIRKHISKFYDDEKIRYYAVSEYGPVHFRSHFHILFFFNSQRLAEDIRQIVHQKWQFGYVDSSFVQSSAASYVAGYVNSNVYLPKVLKMYATRPFSTHSFCLGEAFYKSAIKEIYSSSATEIMRRSVQLNGRFKDIFMWSTLQAKLFPKCKGYYNKSMDEKYTAYTLYRTAIGFCGTTDPIKQARFIVRNMLKTETTNSVYLDLIEYFMLSQRDIVMDAYFEGKLNRFKKEYEEDLVNRIYVELRTSRNFLKSLCEYDWSYESIINGINIIDKFYKDKELYMLNSNYKKMTEIDSEYHQYFYDNEFHTKLLSETDLYKQYNSDVNSMFDKRIKHKKLNDINKIFFK